MNTTSHPRFLVVIKRYFTTRSLAFWVRLGALGAAFFLYVGFLGAPLSFPSGTLVSVEEGTTIGEVAITLKERGVIRSPIAFRGFIAALGRDRGVLYGDYFFERPQSVAGVSWRLSHGIFGLDPIRVTFPEGATVNEMAEILEGKFSEFQSDEFLRLAENDEGYLFPDTYFFLPNVGAKQVYREMRNTFDREIAPFQDDIIESGHSEHEILTMASLLEEEAGTFEDRRTIAGILWKRLSIGMLLQVDSTFLYINGKTTFDLTLDDLRNNESLYNTYKYKGLPPGPITNPGLSSIKAALDPRETPYFFYLSDLSSNLHYSATFEEHKLKKARYLP